VDTPLLARLGADLVLILHAAFVLFVVGGLVAVLVGAIRGWAWVRNRAFRIGHLGAIAFVVLESWWGATCPLTLLEQSLREQAGDATYAGAFLAHWVERALFYRAPEIVFVIAYSLFGALVALAWWKVPPRRRRGA